MGIFSCPQPTVFKQTLCHDVQYCPILPAAKRAPNGHQMALLTVKGIAGMAAGEWSADPAAKGAGRLQVRKLANGAAAYYYRYTAPNGSRVRMPLGTGISLAEARDHAASLSRRYQSGDRDLRTALEIESLAAARASAREREAKERAGTLGDLMQAYIDDLLAKGKQSARLVRNSVYLHIRDAWPAIWASPASDLTLDDLLPIIAKIFKSGRLREAGKVRSYIRAAYAAGIAARQSAEASDALRRIGITSNPARDLSTIANASTPGERALSLAELRAYWRRLESMTGPDGALMRFHLLTGGQRIAQLSRVTITEWDADSQTILILDGKGRRQRPRRHYVPLTPAAVQCMADMRGKGLGPYIFTADHGVSGAQYFVFSRRLAAVVAEMMEAGELPGGKFTPGDIRRTVETRLAAAGQSSDARAHLQSHGLGGVQARHYDRHEYGDEKRKALDLLLQIMTQP